MAARLLQFGEELRGEGVAVGTSELLDAFAVLEHVGWTDQTPFREALSATLEPPTVAPAPGAVIEPEGAVLSIRMFAWIGLVPVWPLPSVATTRKS